ATLLAAQNQLDRLRNQPREEEKAPSQAKVEEAEARFAEQRDLLARVRELVSRRAIGEEEREQREHAYNVAMAQLRRAKAEDRLLLAGAWKWDKDVAAAAVAQAKAQLEQTQTEIDRLVVRCPQARLVKGEVLQVNVRPGEFVGAPPGQALIVLGDVSQKHVRVDIDENDIPRFRRGAPAVARLRGDPRREFRLRFVRVEPYVVPKKSLTGDSTERVDTRVLQVIYALELPADASSKATDVYVGQQLDVFIEAEPPASPSS
ncbi:MAG: HlyD family efflux transporter periplasmic adaptor subunit, partial [Planctomycetes bacterium]|nr:HlyD family efflux transporter periplasmic adaptor subunit [Planctomycetota bacterium]